MGNILGRRKTVKVMKIDGSVTKIKHPATAADVLQSFPGHVILESMQVKLLAEQAKPLHPSTPLKPNKLYFVVQLPDPPPPPSSRLNPRRVRSNINMSAKDRLESLMLARRTTSDITHVRSSGEYVDNCSNSSGPLRIRVRLPKSEVEKLVDQSKDSEEAARRIMELCADQSLGRSGRTEREVSGPLGKKEKRMRFVLPEEEQGKKNGS